MARKILTAKNGAAAKRPRNSCVPDDLTELVTSLVAAHESDVAPDHQAAVVAGATTDDGWEDLAEAFPGPAPGRKPFVCCSGRRAGECIDHLVIGPPGVFTLNAKNHPGAKIWIGGDTFMVNGRRQPYFCNSRFEAQRAATLLSTATGVPVVAVGVIVPLGAADARHVLTVRPALRLDEDSK
jgi:hypothetical protein